MERFFFASLDPRAAAMFRVALSAMLCWNFLAGSSRLTEKMSHHAWQVDLYHRVFLTTPYCALLTTLLLGFGLGWRPRVLGAMLVVLLLPYCLLAQGQQSHQVMLTVLLCFSFVRSDVCWRFSLRPKPGFIDQPASSQPYIAGPIWPIRLIQFQLTIVYGVNALYKTKGSFLSGEALINMSKTLPNFQVNLSDGFLHLGPLLIPVWLLAVGTVVSEFVLAFGFWKPKLRIPLAVFGVIFHMILKLVVRIFMLDWASMFLYLAFLFPFERRPVVKESQLIKDE